MAIRKTLNISKRGNLTVTDAYISITNVTVGQERDEQGAKIWRFTGLIEIFVDKPAKDGGYQPIDTDLITENFPADQTVNPLVWAYGKVKEMSRYSGAVDVLE